MVFIYFTVSIYYETIKAYKEQEIHPLSIKGANNLAKANYGKHCQINSPPIHILQIFFINFIGKIH